MPEPTEGSAPDDPSDTQLIAVRRGDLRHIMAAAWLVHDLYFASYEEGTEPELAAFSQSEAFLDLLAERGLATSEDASAEETAATGVETVVALSAVFQVALAAIDAAGFPDLPIADRAIANPDPPAGEAPA